MGLAASQARFLGITARKNHCELKSMQIAQEKLSVTNMLTQISEDYQRSLDATTLVWDSEMITDGSIYDVSYELLMQPSNLNDYSPQILTNYRNQVVVDSRLGGALSNLGLAQLGGSKRGDTEFIVFIKKLQESGIISSIDSQAIEKLSSNYKKDNGLGGEIFETFDTQEMNLSTLKKYINSITDTSSKYMSSLYETNKAAIDVEEDNPYNQVLNLASIVKFTLPSSVYKIVNTKGDELEEQTLGQYIENLGRKVKSETTTETETTLDKNTKISDSDFDFVDLLEKNVQLTATNKDDFDKLLKIFIEQMYGVMNNLFAINPDSVDSDYLNFAMSQICSVVGMQWDSSNNKVTETSKSSPITSSESAYNHTGVIQNGKQYQVSLSNIAKGIMTYFEVAVEGFDSGYKVNSTDKQLVENSYYITKDPDYIYFINNPAALSNGEDDALLQLNFYSQLFNQICANGWTTNSLVEDPENLKNMLKNGTLFTSTLSDDGMFYQGPYTSNNYIAEVADEDAIARAEAKFKTEQAKLNALEERLNVDMQMVDAELSALTTEYDTVKQMISKGVEKGFSTLGGG